MFTKEIIDSLNFLLSGAFLDFSYDSTQVVVLSSSVNTDYRVLVTEKQHAYIFLKPFQCRARSCRAEHLAGSFVSQVLEPNQHLNFSSVVVTATERQIGALHRTLQSVHASLGAAGLARSVTVSPELPRSSVRIMAKNRVGKRKKWGEVMEFVTRSGSFVQLEMEEEANDVLATSAAMHEAVASFAALSGADAGVVFHLKSRAAPTAAEMVKLVGEVSREKRILGLLVDVSPPRRELAAATRATVHDGVTNPVTVPATNPAMNPVSPGIVTVPSANPGMGFASNSNLPPLYPEPTPTTVPDPTTTTPTTMPPPVTSPMPDMNPVTAPTTPGSVTNPTAPVTNPATTPSTATNPSNTFPDPQQGGGGGGGTGVGAGTGGMPTAPVYQPPAATPGGTAPPATPTVGGQTWCIAKTGLTDMVLQNGINFACGIGGADCSAIQPMGTCYNPNTVQAHASYAFNSYFQRNPAPASCDFGGAGMLVNVNPSKRLLHELLQSLLKNVKLLYLTLGFLLVNLYRFRNLHVSDIRIRVRAISIFFV
jgi:hypothetical protein